jgi:hypothetical protein
LSEVIKAARINGAIDFIMSHLGCEKISFMPPVATLRYYNGRLFSTSALPSLDYSFSSLLLFLCLFHREAQQDRVIVNLETCLVDACKPTDHPHHHLHSLCFQDPQSQHCLFK